MHIPKVSDGYGIWLPFPSTHTLILLSMFISIHWGSKYSPTGMRSEPQWIFKNFIIANTPKQPISMLLVDNMLLHVIRCHIIYVMPTLAMNHTGRKVYSFLYLTQLIKHIFNKSEVQIFGTKILGCQFFQPMFSYLVIGRNFM